MSWWFDRRWRGRFDIHRYLRSRCHEGQNIYWAGSSSFFRRESLVAEDLINRVSDKYSSSRAIRASRTDLGRTPEIGRSIFEFGAPLQFAARALWGPPSSRSVWLRGAWQHTEQAHLVQRDCCNQARESSTRRPRAFSDQSTPWRPARAHRRCARWRTPSMPVKYSRLLRLQMCSRLRFLSPGHSCLSRRSCLHDHFKATVDHAFSVKGHRVRVRL